MPNSHIDPIEVVTRIIALLNDHHVPYMLVGSLSLNLYAVPRHTNDADFVAQLENTSLSMIIAALGPDFQLDQQMGFETITSTIQHRVEHLPTGFVIEFFDLTQDPHDQARFSRRKTVILAGTPTSVPTPEDVVIQKLRWASKGRRTKDLADAENIIAMQHQNLDLPYIRHWCDQHGTRDLFESILAQLPS